MALNEKIIDLVRIINELRNALDRHLLKLADVVPEVRGEVLARTYIPVDLEDVGEAYVLRADLPGFDRSEVKVRVSEEVVEIFAELSEEKKRMYEGRKFVLRERIFERIRRVVRLPSRVDPNAAKAKLSNGVLEVYLPKIGAIRQVELRLE